jgi:hypothetical protein
MVSKEDNIISLWFDKKHEVVIYTNTLFFNIILGQKKKSKQTT